MIIGKVFKFLIQIKSLGLILNIKSYQRKTKQKYHKKSFFRPRANSQRPTPYAHAGARRNPRTFPPSSLLPCAGGMQSTQPISSAPPNSVFLSHNTLSTLNTALLVISAAVNFNTLYYRTWH